MPKGWGKEVEGVLGMTVCKGNKVKGSAVASGLTTTFTTVKGHMVRVKYSPGTSSAVGLLNNRPLHPMVGCVERRSRRPRRLSRVTGRKFNNILYVRANKPAPKLKYTKHKVVTAFRLLRSLQLFRACGPSIILCSMLKSIIYNKFTTPVQRKCTRGIIVIASKRGVTLCTTGGVSDTIHGFRSHDCTEVFKLVLGREGIRGRARGMRTFTRRGGVPVINRVPEDSRVVH